MGAGTIAGVSGEGEGAGVGAIDSSFVAVSASIAGGAGDTRGEAADSGVGDAPGAGAATAGVA